MDDLYADGGGAAAKWQRRHQARKNHEAKVRARQLVRQEAKADLRKRTKKWRARLKAQTAANKTAGLPPPTKHGRPRDMKRPQWVDIAGQRYGRLVAIRIAPVSKSQGRNRRWWVRCDCGSGERLVAATNLRQGIVHSCGCLVVESHKKRAEKRKADRQRLEASPLSIQLAALRRRILDGKRIIRRDAQLLSLAWEAVVEDEVRHGIRRRCKSGRAPLVLDRKGRARTLH